MAMQIGDLIRTKREEHGLTQEQLAELIGKSAGYIGQLERGLSMASIPTLKRLVNVLSLDANQIFYDEKQEQYQFSELENMLSELDAPVQKFIQDSIRTAFHKNHS
ncbi:helix-turn-helix domain-containing protein [Candidatus Pseudoscillospira sp. SGI.172]|uniref:helix-turn-helix domain-containing protein n=1 Tax=Candidatus Pseudoscillospira sp. SGI.172 TaxID=3420582 RepID=UPI002A7E7D13|nr:helix-turn-helix domain-containing protein [Pseudoflavonifractor sp.]MDY3019107.1 helix-turn-helix transcriptional regulator [Oscillospiraceae bacterium]